MPTPDCPFRVHGDAVVVEFIEDKSLILSRHDTPVENLKGHFVVTGKGPGLTGKESDMDAVSIGDSVIFQPQNCFKFETQYARDRTFYVIRAPFILLSWLEKPEAEAPAIVLGKN